MQKMAIPHTIIAIGASAGGLKALQSMVSGLTPDDGHCYVIAQHLSPDYESNMVNLLAKHTPISVVSATNGQRLEANTIYVCPENANIQCDNLNLHLTIPLAEQAAAPNINLLLHSLATVDDCKIIGVILSGVGTDGAEGLKFLKSYGGKTIIQDPESAQYDGMIQAAAVAADIDYIARAENIGAILNKLRS